MMKDKTSNLEIPITAIPEMPPYSTSEYDDGNIPEIDMPDSQDLVPGEEDDRPRQDGPGGE